jgi:hypothetical protein
MENHMKTKTIDSMTAKKWIAPALGLILLAGGAGAQAPSNANAVFIGGTLIMRVRVAAAGYSPERRAAAIQQRLNRILAHGPILPTDITVSPFGNEAVVRVKDRLLFTADMATARFNGATPMNLANQWATHIRAVLPDLTQAK